MYALAQPAGAIESSPKSSYAESFTPPLMKGSLPVPESDADLATLLRQSKAAWDGNADAKPEAKREHVKAVETAVKAYHSKNPTPLSKQAVAGIEGDANLKPHR